MTENNDKRCNEVKSKHNGIKFNLPREANRKRCQGRDRSEPIIAALNPRCLSIPFPPGPVIPHQRHVWVHVKRLLVLYVHCWARVGSVVVAGHCADTHWWGHGAWSSSMERADAALETLGLAETIILLLLFYHTRGTDLEERLIRILLFLDDDSGEKGLRLVMLGLMLLVMY